MNCKVGDYFTVLYRPSDWTADIYPGKIYKIVDIKNSVNIDEPGKCIYIEDNHDYVLLDHIGPPSKLHKMLE